MLRRLHPVQPESFAFTPANLDWAQGQISKYPAGRQQSAIIPLLFRAQEQEGWLSRPAIEHVADLLGMPYMRALEVATFYFMFQLQPTGAVAHVQVCGTTSCMICGAEDLISVCREKIAAHPHEISADGALSWEEVECLGACANAPMAQIGKDYYEDLDRETFAKLLDELRAGGTPVPGSRAGRYSSEPAGKLTALTGYAEKAQRYNASVQLAVEVRDGVKRIEGTEVPLSTPWAEHGAGHANAQGAANPNLAKNGLLAARAPQPAAAAGPDAAGTDEAPEARPSEGVPADATGVTVQEAQATTRAKPAGRSNPAEAETVEEQNGHAQAADGPSTAEGPAPAAAPAAPSEAPYNPHATPDPAGPAAGDTTKD